MKRKVIEILIILMLLSIGILSGCVEEGSSSHGVGIVTDKWNDIVLAGYGSRTAYYFEINDSFYFEVDRFSYYNFEINQSYTW